MLKEFRDFVFSWLIVCLTAACTLPASGERGAIGQAAARSVPYSQTFDVPRPSEVVAVIHAGCARCSWGAAGREAAALRVQVDGKYSQHLLLVRGDATADYPITLGALSPGSHAIAINRDPALSAPEAGAVSIEQVDIRTLAPSKDDADAAAAQAMAPILHARANTVGRFTDLPILMWYEIVPTSRGRQFRYSVIFTNEDGGTATDRLMATWGRTTDIEFVYGAELDAAGEILAEEFQGPGHEVPAFRGRHEARHPLLWVSTDNNMVSESGETTLRYAPAPERFDLSNVSREVVMDAHPWSYAVAGAEMLREGKIVDAAVPGSGKIPDSRRFAFVEACVDLDNAAVAFSVRATEGSAVRWFDSDRGRPEFRIARTGCFRGAVPLPATASAPDAVRFRAYPPQPRKDAPAPPPGAVRVTRVNRLFMLGEDYLPKPSVFNWSGSLALPVGGDWVEIRQ
jgi:hypothetical protein